MAGFLSLSLCIGRLSRDATKVLAKTRRNEEDDVRKALKKISASSGDVFLSADITGWSPCMDIELGLEFVDLLLSFYGKPAELSTKHW